MKEHVKR